MVEFSFLAFKTCISISFVISILVFSLFSIGELLKNLLRLNTEKSASTSIALGLVTMIAIGWYSFRLGIQVERVIEINIISGVLIGVIFYLKKIKFSKHNGNCAFHKVPYEVYLVPILLVIYTAQAIISFRSPSQLVGRIMNNDIFSWSLLADQLIGASKPENIFPGGVSFLERLKIDAWGTYFSLATISKLTGMSSLESTPYFVIFCLSIFAFIVYEILIKSFNLSSIISFCIAIISGGSSFLFYIAYNGFYGQLLATIFYLTVILMIVRSNDNREIKFVEDALLYAFLFIGILLVYQSGFLVFLSLAVILLFLHSLIIGFYKRGLTTGVFKSTGEAMLPLISGIALALAFLPELTLHLINRTLLVYDITAGWPLPLISPLYFFAVPIPPFPRFDGMPVHYISALLLFFALFIFTVSSYGKKFKILSINVISLFVFFITSIAIYLLAYAVKGNSYQVWKLASYVVIPLGFVINTLIVINLSRLKCLDRTKNMYLSKIIITGISVCFVLFSNNQSMEKLTGRINALKSIQSALYNENVKNVVLALPPYSETMLAFNVLSKKFKIYPLSVSYLPAFDASLVNRFDSIQTRILIPIRQNKDIANEIDDCKYAAIQLDKTNSSVIYFNDDNIYLANLSGLKFVEGFSGPESWGTWTIGNKAQLQINKPYYLNGKNIKAIFEINPFGKQNIVVKINGVVVGRFCLTKPAMIKVALRII